MYCISCTWYETALWVGHAACHLWVTCAGLWKCTHRWPIRAEMASSWANVAGSKSEEPSHESKPNLTSIEAGTKCAVLDASAVIASQSFHGRAEKLFTTPEVFAEIHDRHSRQLLATLPAGIVVQEPTEASISAGNTAIAEGHAYTRCRLLIRDQHLSSKKLYLLKFNDSKLDRKGESFCNACSELALRSYSACSNKICKGYWGNPFPFEGRLAPYCTGSSPACLSTRAVNLTSGASSYQVSPKGESRDTGYAWLGHHRRKVGELRQNGRSWKGSIGKYESPFYFPSP